MGFGGGNFSQQDATLVGNMLGQQNSLAQQQSLFGAAVNNEDSGILGQMRQNLALLEGATPQQQKKSVNFGVMDFVKTSPAGLANKPANTGLMGLLG